MIEDKLKWTDEDIKKKYGYKTFTKYKLKSMLNMVFDCSPFKAINTTYPGKFKEKDFNNVPINYWTKERAISEMKALLDELTEEEIKKNVSVNFFVENGLKYPFELFFSSRPFMVIDTIYPKRFDRKDFYIRIK